MNFRTHLPVSRLFTLLSVALISSALLIPSAFAATMEAESLYKQAMLAYQEKALIRAADLFKKATDADASFVNAWFNLGAVNFRLEKYEDARYAFQKALWRAPADYEIRYNLALALQNLGRNDEAINHYEKIPTTHPKFKEAQNQIAILKKQGAGNTTLANNVNTSTRLSTSQAAQQAMAGNSSVYANGLVGPTGMTIGPAGELYVANYTKNNIVKILPNGNSSTVTQGGLINGPIGLVRDPRNGNLYVANYIAGSIVSITPSGSISKLKEGFGKPYYLFFDSLTNRLFVSEQEGNRVSVIKM